MAYARSSSSSSIFKILLTSEFDPSDPSDLELDWLESHVCIGSSRFGGCVELRGVSQLGDAILGLRKWEGRKVLKERGVVLGSDSEAAWEYVDRVRSGLKSRWKQCFSEMIEAESIAYGDNSYFGTLKGLSVVAELKQQK